MFVVFPHHSIPDGSLLASLIRSESNVRARHQRASPEVPLAARAVANTCTTNTHNQTHTYKFLLVNITFFVDQISWKTVQTVSLESLQDSAALQGGLFFLM